MTREEWNQIYELATDAQWYANRNLAAPPAKVDELVRQIVTLKPSGGTPPPEPEPEQKTMKIAIVVGHNKSAPGASGRDPINASEFTWNNQVADAMIKLGQPGLELRKFNRTPGGGYSAEIKRVYAEVKDWGAKAAVELHFNAADGSASGSEVLHAAGTKDATLALAMLVGIVEAMKLPNRGLKPIGKSGRGGASLFALNIPTVLVEPFFGDNQRDANQAAKLGPEGLAKAYLGGLRRWIS